MLNYIRDFTYGATKYPCVLFRPKVFVGYFESKKYSSYQKMLFSSLIKIGFKRTFWQLVFPGQTAGLIKKIPVTNSGANEYHVRFYDDGIIECELEIDRWSSEHWTGSRHCGQEGNKLLKKIIEEEISMPSDERKELLKLFGTKNFTSECVRLR